ncbi:Candidapepsin-3 [Yarrowia sp. B02]|nr:Candidapepsin-3 [Yarrowia sp. B02]
MLFSTTLLASFLALVSAAPSHPKALTFPITRHHRDSKFAEQHLGHLEARQTPVTIANQQYYYSIAVGLGTPVQQFNLLLDTGSSDLWVYNITDTTDCGNNACQFTGQYNSDASSSYNFLSDDYFIQYVSGNASGNWGTETLSVGSISLPNFQFAVADNAQGNTGVLGVSVEGSESLAQDQSPYPNFPVALQNAGYIDRQVYSLYLDDAQSSTGTFLLGGIDHAKFSGSLTVLPLTSFNALQVAFNSISYNGEDLGGNDVAVLDSGTSYTYIPDNDYQVLAKKLKLGAIDRNSGLADIDCNADVSVDFNFEGVTITAKKEQLIVNFGDGTCGFGIASNNGSAGFNLFGDTFLRNAYVAYDLQDSQIGLAQAVYTTETNIQPVSAPLQ